MTNAITITVEDLPNMTVAQADELRRRLKRSARKTVEAFLHSPEPKVLIAERGADNMPTGQYTVKDPNRNWEVIAHGLSLAEAEAL